MKKILPMLIAGFGAAVLSIVPILKGFSCCLLIPFASMMSLFLDIRVNKNLDRIRISKAVWFGFLTGFFATIFFVAFDLIITFITKTNDLIESLPQSEMIINQMNLGDLAKEPMELIRSMAENKSKWLFFIICFFDFLFEFYYKFYFWNNRWISWNGNIK